MSVDLTDNLTFYAKFDELSSSDAAVDEVAGNDLTAGSFTVGPAPVTGALNGARWCRIDGGGGSHFYRSASSPFQGQTSGFAVNIWVRLVAWAVPWNTLVSLRDAEAVDLGYQLRVSNAGLLNFFVSSDGSVGGIASVNSGVTLSLDTWYMISAEHDPVAQKIRVLVNGGSMAESTFTASKIFNASAPFNVGSMNLLATGVQENMDGYVDELGIWHAPLYTAGGFTQLYNGGTPLAYEDFAGGGGGDPVIKHQSVFHSRIFRSPVIRGVRC